MVQVVREGGRSDTQQLDLEVRQPPSHFDRGSERCTQVLSHYDEHLRDTTWRYRVIVEHQVMQPGHSAIDVRP